eukprot:scaffold14004_cov111-Isochrysis_galbana.AAC.4
MAQSTRPGSADRCRAVPHRGASRKKINRACRQVPAGARNTSPFSVRGALRPRPRGPLVPERRRAADRRAANGKAARMEGGVQNQVRRTLGSASNVGPASHASWEQRTKERAEKSAAKAAQQSIDDEVRAHKQVHARRARQTATGRTRCQAALTSATGRPADGKGAPRGQGEA